MVITRGVQISVFWIRIRSVSATNYQYPYPYPIRIRGIVENDIHVYLYPQKFTDIRKYLSAVLYPHTSAPDYHYWLFSTRVRTHLITSLQQITITLSHCIWTKCKILSDMPSLLWSNDLSTVSPVRILWSMKAVRRGRVVEGGGKDLWNRE